MQRITAALMIAMGSCFLVANNRTDESRPASGISIEARVGRPIAGGRSGLILTVKIGPHKAETFSVEEIGLTGLALDLDSWRETAEDALRKGLHMA